MDRPDSRPDASAAPSTATPGVELPDWPALRAWQAMQEAQQATWEHCVDAWQQAVHASVTAGDAGQWWAAQNALATALVQEASTCQATMSRLWRDAWPEMFAAPAQ